MKKRTIFISVIVGIGILLAIGLWFALDTLKPEHLEINVKPVQSVNYNNYVLDNCLDCKKGVLAWQSNSLFLPKLTLISQHDDVSALLGITAPFQLLDDRVVYIKNGTLKVTHLNNKQDEQIAKDVSSFIATENRILYLSEDFLLQYEFDTKEKCVLGDNVYQFIMYQEKVYVVGIDSQLKLLETDGSWSIIYTFKETDVPLYVMMYENAVVYLQLNELKFVDLYTGQIESVRLSDDNYANNRICYICDNDSLFVSFQATKTDGSIVRDIDHPYNGVWSVNLHTKEKKKLIGETFQQLYLFDATLLFGVQDSQLYQISLDNGDVIRISS